MNTILSSHASDYLAAGLSVLPAKLSEKRPDTGGKWKEFQTRLPTESELDLWMSISGHHDAICVIAGAVSGNLEMIDFDCAGELFEKWTQLVVDEEPELYSRLVIEQSPSGGFHAIYRCVDEVCGSLKLAQRREDLDGPDEVERFGKRYKPRRDQAGRWHIVLTMIETRGEGGLFLCAPSTGYELRQGAMTQIPTVTTEERETLLQCAWVLNEMVDQPVGAEHPISATCALRPGDDFNDRGDIRRILERHGWNLARDGENQFWRRPGKDKGWSATLKDGVFYVFSSSADPFEPNRAYSRFSVYTMLEHGGDFSAASSALRTDGYGKDVEIQPITLTCGQQHQEQEVLSYNKDPGEMPDEMLRVPGLMSEVMDFCMETAPYPNHVMAFCGALSLQAHLAARKVRDPGDNRTNVYLLGLAHSASGKDWPRKLNVKILHAADMAHCLGEHFASGEGVQDALYMSPAMLFQTDEIDGMLQSINKAKDARHESIMGTMLTLYSSANSVFPMRRKAGDEHPGSIDQPCLSIFGTAIPNHYYQALSERMLTNGFFARMLILECGKRGKGQEPTIRDLPATIIEKARWWAEFSPGTGNLEQFHPVPMIVEHTPDARSILIESREMAEYEYGKAESVGDTVGTTVWGRVSEHARKLALIYAVSECNKAPSIGRDAARWAVDFVMHQTRRMLFMASSHVADNPFHGECLKLLKKIRESEEDTISRTVLLKRMKTDAQSFERIISTLKQSGDLVEVANPTLGRTGIYYKLIG